ncbi:MAG: hypothetical protein D6812_14380 [Deltaproteobacteria bacterium]|nr:MAG: hypothetical protein D6812_14380 [Deltaproteobacteria bacterium]
MVERAIFGAERADHAVEAHLADCSACRDYAEACRLLTPLAHDVPELSEIELQAMIRRTQAELERVVEQRAFYRLLVVSLLALPGVLLFDALLGWIGYRLIALLSPVWQPYLLLCLGGWLLMGLSLSYGSLPILFGLSRNRSEVFHD